MPQLTEVKLRSIKAEGKIVRYHDEKGLYLEVSKAGGKYWRMKYRFAGKEKRLSFGRYPDVSLKAARQKRDEARLGLAKGFDPKVTSISSASETFQAVGEEWAAKHLATKAVSHASRVLARLSRDIYPFVGHLPIAQITPVEILRVVQRIEARGAGDTAHRALQNISQIMRYAVATCRREIDPTPSLRGALLPVTTEHMAAPTEPVDVAGLLRMIAAFRGGPVVCAALRLMPLLFARPGTFRKMEWSEIDLVAAEWRIPAEKMKMREAHIVPLARQVMRILTEDLQPLTGSGQFVFSGGRDPRRPMSDAAINAAYRRMGIDTRTELTGHGWRATARTLLHERLGYDPAIIEHQLAHRVPDALGRAYNRTKFLDTRREMMQAWADYLDELRKL